MRVKLLSALIISAGLIFGGCTTTGDKVVVPVEKQINAPTAGVAKLIKKFNLEVVDYNYAKKAIGNGTRSSALAILIDARPEKLYVKSTIPTSINIPDTQFYDYVGQLDNVAKDKEIIVFCGGWGCGKSPKVAGMLKAKGFTNVKLYQAGEPEWKKMTYVEVGTPVVEAAYKNNSALLIDARPYVKFLGATIPGSMSIPDTQMAGLEGKFPVDKNTPIITFCGGYNCHKSHVVADRLLALGYTDVKVYAAGMPEWSKEGMATTASKATKALDTAPWVPTVRAGLKEGEDAGTVDGEWFKSQLEKLPANVVIVDVRSPMDFKSGHIKGAINVQAEKYKAAEFAALLPKDKVVVFTCSSGGRAMESLMKLDEAKIDTSMMFYFDANVACKGNVCKIEVNEPLG